MQRSQRSLYFDLSVLFGSLAVLAYFGWHGFYGPRSFEHGEFVKSQVKKYQAELVEVQARREQRNARVRLLRPQSIDPDMLDEMARKTLNFAADDEFAVINNKK